MSIARKIGFDTISRLEKAAEKRYEEAFFLAKNGHRLTSIYLAGYAAEMTIGAAYFGIVHGYDQTSEIQVNNRDRFVAAGKQSSKMADKSHPLDGLACVLIRENKALNRAAFDVKIERTLKAKTEVICVHWSPKLRYRAIEATSAESDVVLEAARWILDHCPKR